MKRKLEAMHARYGCVDGKCRDCDHLTRKLWNKWYIKCALYGDTNCEATDWRMKWQACGMFNKPLPDKFTPIVRFVAAEAREKQPEPPLDGQIGLFAKEADYP